MKAAKDSDEDKGNSSNNDDDDDGEKVEIAHLARRISKAQIKRKEKKGFVPKKDKKGKANQDEVICFECKEPGHVRSECPRLKKNSKKKIPKRKAMVATWEDHDEKQESLES